MSMVEPDSLPPEAPPMADPGGVPMPSQPPPWNPSVSLADLSGARVVAAPAAAVAAPPVVLGADIAQLSHQAAAIKNAEVADKERIRAEEEPRLAAHRAEMEKRFAQTAVNPEDYKPFDTEAAREKYKYNPVEAFGSLGSVFAIVASAFTNRPMENSMYGAAAAMNAVKAGNEQEYDRARKDWQDNAALAVKRQAAQHQSYSDAAAMVTTDMSLAQHRMKESALRYGDKQMLSLMDAGLWDKAIELMASRNKITTDMIENAPKLSIATMKQADLLRIQNLPIEQQLGALRDHNNTWAGGKETVLEKQLRQAQVENGNVPLTVEQTNKVIADHTEATTKASTATDIGEQMQRWDAANADMPEGPEKAKARADELIRLRGATGRGASVGTPQAVEIKRRTTELMEQINPTTGAPYTQTEADTAARQQIANANKPARQIDPVKQLFVNEFKSKNEGRDPTSAEIVEWEKNRKAVTERAGAVLEPGDAVFLAEQALRGDTSVFTNLGRGKQGAENVIAVRKEIRRLAQERGMSGQDMALQNAEYMGLRAGMRVAGSREAIIGTAANEAINMMVVAQEAAAAVPRTRWVPINQLAQYASRQASYPELAAFAQANESLVNGYVRAISPTGVPTDLVRKHAYNALTTAQGPEAYAAVLEVMKKEMYAALSAPDQVRQQLIAREKKIRDGDHSPLFNISTGKDSNTIRYDKDGNRIK